MKIFLFLTLAAFPLLSQTPAPDSVTVAVKITTGATAKTYSVDLPAPVLKAMAQFVAESKTEGTDAPKYTSIADLLFKVMADRLISVLVPRYPDSTTKAAIVAAEAASKAASDATTASAALTVTVK